MIFFVEQLITNFSIVIVVNQLFLDRIELFVK